MSADTQHWLVGRKIRSFDFSYDLSETGETACFIEGWVTEVNPPGRSGAVCFTPTRCVFTGEEDSPEDLPGPMLTWLRNRQGDRIESGALRVIG